MIQPDKGARRFSVIGIYQLDKLSHPLLGNY
jgi:hypothetical protein